MKIKLSLLAALVVLAILIVTPVSADKPDTSVSWWLSMRQRDKLVEQQTIGGATQPDPALWVVNRTGCVWDPDEQMVYSLMGRWIQPGETVSVTTCIVGDWSQHLFVMRADAGLEYTLQVGDRSWSGTGLLCAYGPRYIGKRGGPYSP